MGWDGVGWVGGKSQVVDTQQYIHNNYYILGTHIHLSPAHPCSRITTVQRTATLPHQLLYINTHTYIHTLHTHISPYLHIYGCIAVRLEVAKNPIVSPNLTLFTFFTGGHVM